jgi:hypothetical protein
MCRFSGIGSWVTVLLVVCNSTYGAVGGLQRVASGLSNPMFVTHAPDDPTRLFIAQRSGAIRILNLETGVLQPTPFLTMTGVDTEGEGGFLGLAFHPNYSSQGMPGFGKFYVSVTTNGSPLTSRIREFEVSATDPNMANPASMREILSFPQPQSNHNGGWIDFSPVDGFLYMSSGDGGGSNDSGGGHTAGTGNAQDITNNLLGKYCASTSTATTFPPTQRAIMRSRLATHSRPVWATPPMIWVTTRSGRTDFATRFAIALTA